ncbi:helix-turn-helix transcriptional regulator [Desulfococcus sp.]|uniref:helix-turn-helix transcriptional regulator n=1 Tax=Desulfococcus sp. TaxID=2025834 RepID=UPI003593F2C5
MSDRLKFERFMWFHTQIKRSRFPNSISLIDAFEVSSRTAQRDIEFMRDRLHAPLEFDRSKNGYRYTDDTYEIPAHWISEDNMIALALAARLASTIPDAALKEDLCRLIGRMTDIGRKTGESCIERISDKISVKNVEYAKVNEKFFRLTVRALFDDGPLRITYHSPHSSATTVRTVQPLHLMHYMGSWHLLAWCAAREAIRDFALSRLLAVEPAEEPVDVPKDLPPLKEYTRRHFGIMQGDATREVRLRFSPRIAALVGEQVWHPQQESRLNPDGGLLLSFPAADFRELVKVILGYGAEVRVVSPPELQTLIRQEIDKMNKIYDHPDIG